MRRALTAILVLLALGALAAPAYAVDAPDSLKFEPAGAASDPEFSAYRDLLQTGDLLVVAQYNIAYASLPEDGAQVNFIGRALKSTTSIGTNVPYPYNDSGYGKGVIAWYLTPTTTNAQGWYNSASGTWDQWGATLTDLHVDLSTNPTVFDPADQRTVSSALASGDFSTGSGQATNQSQLATKIVNIARGLEAAWGTSLVNESGRLNSTAGGPYFQLAIPGIKSMAPDAFGSSSQSPTVPTPVPTPGGAGTIAETAETRFSGTFWLTPAFDATGTTLGLPAGAFEGIVSSVTILIMVGLGLKFGGPGGAAMGFAVGAGVILPVFTVLGFISWGYGVFGIAALVLSGIVKLTRDNF